MDEYEIGIMTTSCKIKAPSIESAIIGFAMGTNINTNIGLDTLAMIAIYSVNGKKFVDKNPFALKKLDEHSHEELQAIMDDVNKITFCQ